MLGISSGVLSCYDMFAPLTLTMLEVQALAVGTAAVKANLINAGIVRL
jgi:hypothetical protein